jgi:transcriptional regulator with XRE-family HTH domain
MNKVDVAIGQNLRRLRLMRDVEVSELAAAMDITHSHLIYLELGHLRLTAARMYVAARFLNVDIKDFYVGVLDAPDSSTPED